MTTDTEPDDALVRAIARGDTAALARVFDRHAGTLTRFAWPLAVDRTEVEQIVQDTFLTLWDGADRLHLSTTHLLPWLLAVARDRAGQGREPDGTRRDGHDTRAAEHDGQDPADPVAPAGRAAAAERLRWVRDEIAALPEADRRLCEVCLLDGHSYAAAADLLGLGTAATQQHPRTRRRTEKVVMHDEH
jgi:DNA-directed RNA polymerase specialized sigma24 family protein